MRIAPRWLTRALLPIRRRGQSLARDDRASTAIEFGILAVPFFALIGAIIETSMVFFAGQVLDSAVQDAARQIRTGQAQGQAGYTIDSFRNEICNGLYRLFDCSKVKVKVSVLTTFSNTNTTLSQPIKTGCTITPTEDCWNVTQTYAPGVGSSIVLVEAYYKWPVIINFGGFNLQNQPDGSRLLAAVRVFRNEPFS